MTYLEYLAADFADYSQFLETPHLPEIPLLEPEVQGGYTVRDWFFSRYGDRELIYEPEKWEDKALWYFQTIAAHYGGVLRAFFKANETILAEYSKTVSTEQHSTATPGDVTTTRYSAPNGTVNYSYTDGEDRSTAAPSDLDAETTVTEKSTNPDEAEKIARFATELAFIYVRLLDSFEPLFKGVF